MTTSTRITDKDLRKQLATSLYSQKLNMQKHYNENQFSWYIQDRTEMVTQAKNTIEWQQQKRNVARIPARILELNAKINEVKQQLSKLINPFGHEAYVLNSLWTKYEKELGEM